MIITSNKDDTVWKKSDETGDIEVMGYQIFSGIQLFFMDAHMQSYTCVHEEVAKEDSECPLYKYVNLLFSKYKY